jgi:hypothetical protein
MKTMKRCFFTLLIMAAATSALWSQNASSDRVVVPFSDPGKPGLVKASLINGGILVKATSLGMRMKATPMVKTKVKTSTRA